MSREAFRVPPGWQCVGMGERARKVIWVQNKTLMCEGRGSDFLSSFPLSEIRFGCIVWLGSLVGFIPNEDKNFTEPLALISLIWCSQTIEEGTTIMAEMVLHSVVI